MAWVRPCEQLNCFTETVVAVICYKQDAACCAGVTPEKHLAALETMHSCQIQISNIPIQGQLLKGNDYDMLSSMWRANDWRDM